MDDAATVSALPGRRLNASAGGNYGLRFFAKPLDLVRVMAMHSRLNESFVYLFSKQELRVWNDAFKIPPQALQGSRAIARDLGFE